MAPAEPSPREPHGATLEGIGEEIRSMAAAMATKADLLVHTTSIQDALRAEIAGIRSEVTAHTGRIQDLEHSQETQATRLQATDTALARQGEMLLHMRRTIEDLDNRGRRCNIRVRGVPESDGETIENTLNNLFDMILGADAPHTFRYERAHRALRPRSSDDNPRDIICCLSSFRNIMPS
ncbi:Hypothetical predicted protein [Pelobates cultripes]|uniref:Uncharacterized protein n=1 Tax=Pelobates cultripes TaxID=61616 RepID=A0AAD1SR91_PELCU|nr:Hypothetical predicted protein [Pelobates cultripes]